LEASRIQTVDDFSRFVDSRANQLLLTEPRPVKVFDAEGELEALFRNLVGGRRRNARMNRHIEEINAKVESLLNERGVGGIVERNVQVEIPLLERALKFPFVYQNGRTNLVQTVLFDATKQSNLNRACELAIEGHELKEQPENYQLNILASFEGSEPANRHVIEALLAKYEVPIFDTSKIEEFADRIAREAH
jgi:hypothetical protein